MEISFISDWLEKHQKPCPFKQHYGFDCLGCGAQTSLIHLLKGEILKSFETYPALIPLLILFLLFVTQLFFKSNKVYKVLKIWFIFTLLILIFSYIIKMINI